MNFGEKVKKLRKELGYSQKELASNIGVSTKSIYNYETDNLFPKDKKVIQKLAEIFNVSVDYLITDTDNRNALSKTEEDFISSAKEDFGYKGKKEAEALVEKTAAMMAGGSLSEEDQDAFFQSITKIYFDAKAKAREKYGRKNKSEE